MRLSVLATALSLGLGTQYALADNTSSSMNQQSTNQQSMDQQPAQHSEADKEQPVDVFFETDSAVLPKTTFADIKTLAQWARCNPKGAIILEGYTDPTGTVEYNAKLGGERAVAVRDKLVAMGVPSERIVIAVYGELGPKRPTYAEERRVTARAGTTPLTGEDFSG